MGSLGFQTVYALFNAMESVVCERFFLGSKGKDHGQAVAQSLESGKALADFDVIALSLSFENDYPHLFDILGQSGIPLLAKERDQYGPLIIAGGVACWLNPEPLAPFIDCFLIGEAEKLIPPFLTALQRTAHFKSISNRSIISDKHRFLADMANAVPGLYAPLLYETTYAANGAIESFQPLESVPASIPRQYAETLSHFSTCSTIVCQDAAFNDAYLVEIGRGCPHGCRFCSAGYIYRPPRFRSLAHLKQDIQQGAKITRKIGLLGAAVSDLSEIGPLCASASKQNIALSFSSLRADAITPELTAAMQRGGVKTAVIAPDAGSERMRRVINKGITEADILSAAECLVKAGILNLKLYFMVGLPTETAADVEAIIALCLKIKAVFLDASRINRRIGEITVSLNAFTPKPFTPFQWAAMDDRRVLKHKIQRIRKRLKPIANVRLQVNSLRQAYLQGLLSRGDRRVSDLLLLARKNRWNWPKTLKETPLDPDFFSLRERGADEILPWDFIDHGIRKTFLWSEHQRALSAQPTAPCAVGDCHRCGVC